MQEHKAPEPSDARKDVERKPDAANIAERLARLNRKQRRGVIARAKKQARAAARKERGNK